jgi:hypothetical protein
MFAMPSESKAQHRFMAVMANNPAEAAQHGISPETAAEFVHADAGQMAKLPQRKRKKPSPKDLARVLTQR